MRAALILWSIVVAGWLIECALSYSATRRLDRMAQADREQRKRRES